MNANVKDAIRARSKKCIRCSKTLRLGSRLRVIKTIADTHFYSFKLKKPIQLNDVICNNCRIYVLRKHMLHKRGPSALNNEVLVGNTSKNEELPFQPPSPKEIQMLPECSTHKQDVLPTLEPACTTQALQRSETQPALRNCETMSGTSNSQTHTSDTTATSSLPSQGSSLGDPTFLTPPEKRPLQMEECVEMQFSRPISTHKYCFICFEESPLRVVPFQARLQTFIKLRIYIPLNNRCCLKHLIGDRFYTDEMNMILPYMQRSLVPISELNLFLDQLSLKADATLLDSVSDFSMPEEKLRVLTGYTWENVIEMRSLLTSMRNTHNRDVTQALVVFLYKFRSGTSNAHIAAILGIQYDSVVSIQFQSVVLAFERDILPKEFGVAAHNRRTLIEEHTSKIAEELFNTCGKLVLICDGTYLRHEKSANNSYQRLSYSGQKKQHLIKPFTICCSDGFILDVLGPYTANKNDATILREALEDPTIGLADILRKGDYFVLDRGFRDVKPLLEAKGFKVLMPALKGNRKQLPSHESNYSRFVTKIRWVVESIHGIIGQKFRLLHNKLNNNLLDDAASLCRIACFLINRFGKRLNSDGGKQTAIIQRMKIRKDIPNTLSHEIDENKWERRKSLFHSSFSGEILDFPELNRDDLELLFSVSKAEILGNSEIFVKSGSDINLTCLVVQSPEPPSFIYWYRNDNVINYSSRGGINVLTEKQTKTSRLLISRAQPPDSGNYTCSPSSSEPASVIVHVLNGEHPAAMQHGNSSTSGVSKLLPLMLLLVCQIAKLLLLQDSQIFRCVLSR